MRPLPVRFHQSRPRRRPASLRGSAVQVSRESWRTRREAAWSVSCCLGDRAQEALAGRTAAQFVCKHTPPEHGTRRAQNAFRAPAYRVTCRAYAPVGSAFRRALSKYAAPPVSARLLILGWHNVAGTYGFPSAPGRGEHGLEQQLSILARTANVLPLEETLERMYRGEHLPSRAVALTFDDGYRDNLTLAAPILERLGLPATFFLVPGLLSGEVDAWWETIGWALQSSTSESILWEGMSFALTAQDGRDLAYSQIVRRLKRRDSQARATTMRELLEMLEPTGDPPDLFMDWQGARELVERGFSVQSHTCSHVVLAEEDVESQRRELTEAKRLLEKNLDIDISIIAYPHGGPQDYSADTVTLAGEAEYRWGVTTREAFTTSAVPALETRRCVIYPERGVVDLLAQLRYLFRPRPRGARS